MESIHLNIRRLLQDPIDTTVESLTHLHFAHCCAHPTFTMYTSDMPNQKVLLRGRSRRAKTKSTSSDGILTAGDNLWTYNSMKNSSSGSAGVLVYNGISHNAAYQNTPATIRSFAPVPLEHAPVRPCTATTLRLHPKENSAAYHTVGRYATSPTEFYEEISNEGYYPYNTKCRSIANIQPSASFNGGSGCRRPPPTSAYHTVGRYATSPTEFYEEIPNEGYYPYNTKCRSIANIQPSASFNGGSGCRRPPPTCRPPPVPAPNLSHEYSPNGSEEGSIDRELARSDDVNRMPGYVLSQAPNVHSMTYV
ncbi:unnamed protein product [Strongylus vulgaris]|uniref:Uncharacterized protein n=1 Tax=Strongylus vulgaris TaxID=40348 RepID=A0A3P7IQU9_STRVU|nr:unnamed protein product [Strongylus vulgaris]